MDRALLAAVLASLLFALVSALSAPAVGLFRYRDHAQDGREFEYVFETDEQSAPKTVSEEKAAEIAADWVTTFHHVRVGAIESQEFRTMPIPHWRFCFSDTIKGPIQRMFFAVLLPNGMVVKPNVSTPPKSIERTLCPQESNGEDHEVGQQNMERRN